MFDNRHITTNVWIAFIDALAALLLVFLMIVCVMCASYGNLYWHTKEMQHKIQRSQSFHASQMSNTQKKFDALCKTVDEQNIQNKNLNEERRNLMQQIETSQQQIKASNETSHHLRQVLEQKETEIINLNAQLKNALENEVQRLQKERSAFFAKLRQAFHDIADMRIVEDRFMFQAEVLFSSGSDQLNENGKKILRHLATRIQSLMQKMPHSHRWVLRINGHTDASPIRLSKFTSNWHLSCARALTVVAFLAKNGVPENRLMAAGLGQFYPINALKHNADINRRIELQIDQVI